MNILIHSLCPNQLHPFSGSRDISYTNKNVTDSANNRTLRSSLRAVIDWAGSQHCSVSSPQLCRADVNVH